MTRWIRFVTIGCLGFLLQLTLAVAIVSLVNFVMADRWVFRTPGRACLAALLAAGCLLCPAGASAQTSDALAAWDGYVAAVEHRLEGWRVPRAARPPAGDAITASGDNHRVPSGTISDWHGSVFVRGVTLDQLLYRLQHPGTPPPQDEVISARVIGRTDDSLRTSIRLARHAIVTVTYDTEHEMRFTRWTPRLATARSVATRIEEVGGSDHGFLWRLHSYWRYEETSGGVLVELRSLTLSRSVPALVRPVASPLVSRVARESMVRTLDALRQYFGKTHKV